MGMDHQEAMWPKFFYYGIIIIKQPELENGCIGENWIKPYQLWGEIFLVAKTL